MSGKSRGTCGKQGDHLGILSRRVSKRIRRKTASYEVTSAYTFHLSRSLVFKYPQLRNQHSNCIVLLKNSLSTIIKFRPFFPYFSPWFESGVTPMGLVQCCISLQAFALLGGNLTLTL